MMDPVGTNHALADHSGDDGMPMSGGMGFPMMDSGDLDDLLAQEEQGNENTMGLDESDIEKLLNPDNINIGGLGDFDDLDAMPIKELDGRDSLWGNNNNPSAPSSSNNHTNVTVDLEDDFQPLPFQRRPKQRQQQQQPSGNGSSMQMSGQGFQQQQQQYQQQQYQQQYQQQQGMGQAEMSDDFDPLQRMVDHAFHSNGNNSMAQPNNFSGNNGGAMPNGMMQQQQMNQPSMPSTLDLEQEKQKLLNRLNELNQKQHMPPGNVASAVPTVTSRYGQTTQMSPLSDFLRNKSSAASAVPPVEARGESALTSFLRNGKKGPPGPVSSGAASTMGRSMLSANVPGAPTAASVFSEKPMDIDSLLLRRKPNGAMGRMGGSTAASNPNPVRNLSGRNMRGGIGLASSGSRNAAWGEGNGGASSFQTSGILPKHASDNHLVRAGKVGLTRSRSKAGSVSRENLMYMKKSGSRNQLQRDDSMGQLLPIKRRQGLGAKHKLGVSRSVPALLMNNNNGGFSDESTTNGYQGNALWG